jgi:hypothetical protein
VSVSEEAGRRADKPLPGWITIVCRSFWKALRACWATEPAIAPPCESSRLPDPVLMPSLLGIEGPDPPAMTCHDAGHRRIAALMAFLAAGIFSVLANRTPPNDSRKTAAAFDRIVFSALASGRDGPASTITDYRRAFAIWRRSFDRRRRQARERLAEAWNGRDIVRSE